MKKILFATSEAVPFIKTGGLADVAGSLPKCFDKKYFDIRVILPKYACMKQEWKDKMEYVTHFYMDLGFKNCYVGIMQMQYDGIQFYFIDNEYYFSEDEVLISTGTRNFKGRAGHPSSKIYLGSAATVTASAVAGEIATADRV